MGVATVAAIVAIVAFAATLFRGGLAESVPVTVISPRAGLVMNPDAKVQIRGVQVGKVASIEPLPNGEAALHLAMDPKRLNAIPSNVLVDIASHDGVRREVRAAHFSAGSVAGVAARRPGARRPARDGRDQYGLRSNSPRCCRRSTRRSSTRPSARIASARQRPGREDRPDADRSRCVPGQDRTEPARAQSRPGNRTTGSAGVRRRRTRLRDRRRQRGADQRHDRRPASRTSMPRSSASSVWPTSATRCSAQNRQPLTDVLHLLVPTTDLMNKYNQALWCALGGMVNASQRPPLKEPGVVVLAGLPVGSGTLPLPDGPAEGGRRRAVRSAPVCRICRSRG